jgi:hypothetical protein
VTGPSSSVSSNVPSIAGPIATSGGAPPPPPSASPTPPGRPNRKRLYLGVAVAVVIAGLLVAVFVLPALTGSGAGAILTYSGARPVADRTVGGFQNGGWTLVVAAGVVSATTEPVPLNTTALGNLTSGCTYTLVAGIGGLSLPGFTGNRSSGVSPAWEFLYRNASYALAFVSVINGQGTVFATLTGLECSFYAQLLLPVPGNVIDSSQAAAAVQPEAASFLAQYPNASAEFGLIGGIASFLGVHSVGPEWSVIYNTCALSPSATGTGVQFNATLNALTGQVLSTNTTSGVSCGGSTTAASTVPGTPALAPLSDPALGARP